MSQPKPKYFKAWIIFFLISTVGGAVIGGIIGGVLGLFLGLAHVEISTIKTICAVLGVILGLPLSYFAHRWTVSEFIVKGLTQPLPPVIPPAPPSAASTPHPTA